jgi:uncharacterized protein (TIGR03437 family)
VPAWKSALGGIRRTARRAFLCLVLAAPVLRAQPVFDGPVGLLAAPAGSGSVLYAWSGGLFRSADGGRIWTASYITPAGLPQPPIQALLIDPDNSNILYLGTTLAAGAVWKSLDAGDTWERMNQGLPEGDGAVEALIRSGGGELYAKSGNRLFKSTDGAVSWRQQAALPGSGRAFAIHPVNASLMFYAEADRVFQSTDEGSSWRQTFTLPLFGDRLTAPTAIGLDAADESVVYLGVAGPLLFVGGVQVAGVYKSADGGSSFRNVMPGQSARLVVAPAGGANVYSTSAGAFEVCKSSDRGSNWRCTALAEGRGGGVRLLIDPGAPDIVYAALEAPVEEGRPRLLRSTDGGETWEPVNGLVRPTLRAPAQPPAPRLPEGGSASLELAVSALEQPHWRLDFTASASEPWLSLNQTAGTTPAVLRVTADAAGLPAGTHRGAIQLWSEHTSTPVLEIPVELTVGGFEPRVLSEGLLNAASLASGRTSPGMLFTVFGRDLATAIEAAGAVPWPINLANAMVTIEGIVAPLHYASPTQINGQIPYEAAPGRAAAVVSVSGATSPPVSFELHASSPGIFLYGENRAVAVNADEKLNSAENPAAAGSIVVVYLTGIGPLDHPLASGQGALADPLSRPVAPYEARLGEQPLSVQFLGMTPGFVGLAQANLLVPRLPAGTYPLVIKVGGESSNAAWLSVL